MHTSTKHLPGQVIWHQQTWIPAHLGRPEAMTFNSQFKQLKATLSQVLRWVLGLQTETNMVHVLTLRSHSMT